MVARELLPTLCLLAFYIVLISLAVAGGATVSAAVDPLNWCCFLCCLLDGFKYIIVALLCGGQAQAAGSFFGSFGGSNNLHLRVDESKSLRAKGHALSFYTFYYHLIGCFTHNTDIKCIMFTQFLVLG